MDNFRPGYVVVRDPRHTTSSGARHTTSSSVAEIQHNFSPGILSSMKLHDPTQHVVVRQNVAGARDSRILKLHGVCDLPHHTVSMESGRDRKG